MRFDLEVHRMTTREAASKKGGGPVTTPARLVDLSVFWVGFVAYARGMEARGADEHLKKGLVIARLYRKEMEANLKKHVYPLVEEGRIGGVKGKLNAAKRAKGRADVVVVAQADFLTTALSRMVNKADVLRSVFQGRPRAAAKAVLHASKLEDPAAVLRALAAVPAVSGIVKPRNWVKIAAQNLGAGLTETEEAQSDAETVSMLAEKVADTKQAISTTDPTEARSVALKERKAALNARIEEVVETSQVPAAVAAVAATKSIPPAQDFRTKTGKHINLSPEQEDAMLVRGRAVIAAGAGSGKTRVLAGKIVYHMNELDLTANQILACSFTKKSSAELIERVKNYGGAIDADRQAQSGFGTTHSVALKMLMTYGKRRGRTGDKIISGYAQAELIRLAILQVMMMPAQNTWPEPNADDTFFPNVQGDVDATQERIDELGSVFDAVMNFLEWNRSEYGPSRWNNQSQSIIRKWRSNPVDPAKMTQKQKDFINRALGYAVAPGQKERGGTRRALQRRGWGHYKLAAAAAPVDETLRTAAKEDKGPSWAGRVQSKNPVWGKQPANQWFNLGASWEDDFHEGSGDSKSPIPIGRFALYVSKTKGQLLAPGKAAHEEHNKSIQSDAREEGEAITQENASIFAAVYGAYEWLKNNASEYEGQGDFDDMLIGASKMMIEDRNVRSRIQRRFKMVLADEAQDLNASQHLFLGLVAGHYDPETQAPRKDGDMTADTLAFIGDDKQCVAANSVIATPGISKHASEVRQGDEVLSYRNGKVVSQRVRHAMKSSWTWGWDVITESGQHLLMSPNHKLWVGDIITEGDQHIVYLMWRRDMGFRVGITNKGKDTEYLNHFGGRAFLEKAEKLWVIDVCEDREQALLKEAQYSLRYGIPTAVFNGEHRGLNQNRINSLFEEFGKNGGRLLEAHDLSFDLPNWMSRSYSKHGRKRRTINMIAHSGSNTQVAMEWTGDDLDECLFGIRISKKDGRNRLRRWFANYREALSFAQEVANRTGAMLSRRLSTPEGPMRLVTASAVKPGMTVPVMTALVEGKPVDGPLIPEGAEYTISHEKVVEVRRVEGVDFIDLDVEDASNFFANGILTHNSIYEFRGASPDIFIDKSDLTPGGEGFETKLLRMNYRSGSAIVDAANQMIAHNSKQIKMVCQANVERKGEGSIREVKVPQKEDLGPYVAQAIADQIQGDDAPLRARDFGIAVRTNREAYEYGVAMIQLGIPFRSKYNFFKGPAKSVLSLMQLASLGAEAVSAPPAQVDGLVMDALKSMNWGISTMTFKRAASKARGKNLLAWLLNGGWDEVYVGRARRRNREYVKPFADYLKEITLIGSKDREDALDTQGLLTYILDRKGGQDNKSISENLIERVKNDAKAMEEVSANALKGTEDVTLEDAIRQYAEGPVGILKTAASSYPNIDEFAAYMKELERANAKLQKSDNPSDPDFDAAVNAVQLDTVHGWKGLEAPHLFVPMWEGGGPGHGGFPHPNSESDEDIASERRLAYVAVTRGEDSVTIVRPDILGVTKKGQLIRSKPSRFVTEGCIPTDGLAEKTSSWLSDAEADQVLAQDLPDVEWPSQDLLDRFAARHGTEELRAQWGEFLPEDGK